MFTQSFQTVFIHVYLFLDNASMADTISARWSTDTDAQAFQEPESEHADESPLTDIVVPQVGTAHAFSGQAPLKFVQVDPETKLLVVTDSAREALSKLAGSIGVCAVAGLYRTGKSYILNQLAGQNAGFGIGSSVQAHTKGVWMWGAPIEEATNIPGAPKNLLLLDTEGLSSISQTEGHDGALASETQPRVWEGPQPGAI